MAAKDKLIWKVFLRDRQKAEAAELPLRSLIPIGDRKNIVTFR
jgi:hypothetical protein